MSTSDKIPVSKFLESQSEGDRPGELNTLDPRTATEIAEQQRQYAEMHFGKPEEHTLKEIAGTTILYRVNTCDVAAKDYSSSCRPVVYVQAADPTAAEQKVLAHHKAKGGTHTICVISIERVASIEAGGQLTQLIL